jgi:hypothetical protein
MFILIRDILGYERFIDEESLASCIASGEVTAFRRSEGWVTVPQDAMREKTSSIIRDYRGRERRRSLLGKPKPKLSAEKAEN